VCFGERLLRAERPLRHLTMIAIPLTPLEPGSKKHDKVSMLKHAASLVGDLSAYELALITRHRELSASWHSAR
jgi:hypothetical protein